MKPKTFAQPAWISFQGDRVFRLLQHDPDCAHFELIGFENKVKVIDYRPKTLKTLEKILTQQQNASIFPPAFNTPAFVHIKDLQAPSLEITLTETGEPHPLYMLWTVIGLDDGVPIFDYVATRYAALSETNIAFFSLYRRPTSLNSHQQYTLPKRETKPYSPINELSWLVSSTG